MPPEEKQDTIEVAPVEETTEPNLENSGEISLFDEAAKELAQESGYLEDEGRAASTTDSTDEAEASEETPIDQDQSKDVGSDNQDQAEVETQEAEVSADQNAPKAKKKKNDLESRIEELDAKLKEVGDVKTQQAEIDRLKAELAKREIEPVLEPEPKKKSVIENASTEDLRETLEQFTDGDRSDDPNALKAAFRIQEELANRNAEQRIQKVESRLEQERFAVEQQASVNRVVNEYPELKDNESPLTKMAAEVLPQFKGLANAPELAVTFATGLLDRRARQEKTNGKNAAVPENGSENGKTKSSPKQTKKREPATRVSSLDANSFSSSNRTSNSGNRKDLLKQFAESGGNSDALFDRLLDEE